jgi:cytochrome c553
MRSLVLGAIIAGLPALPLCAQSLDERLPTCFACHGEKGTSHLPETPSLGAQPAFYTTVQLLMFRDRLRVSEPMNEMAKGLSDGDLQKAADVISKLPPPEPISDNSNSARMERGRALAQQHRCNFCHQSNYAGQENVPLLAGQREAQGVARLQGKLAMRLRRTDGGRGLSAQGRGFRRSRLFPRAVQMTSGECRGSTRAAAPLQASGIAASAHDRSWHITKPSRNVAAHPPL